MGIFDLYSKRRKRLAGDVPDVYTYDSIPPAFKTQIVHIWNDVFHPYASENLWDFIVKALRREYGVHRLVKDNYNPHDPTNSQAELIYFFERETDIDRVIDVIELSFRVIDRLTRSYNYASRNNANDVADEAIAEFNERAREHGVGYTYTDGEILRVDSELVHSEAVKPALIVLRQRGFESAQEEFLSAHEHYRHGRMHEALVDALKAFESVMKIICAKRGWAHSARPTASELVGVCITNGLIPAYWQTHFGGLRSVLESGIPTPRNRQGGHGAGAQPVQEPPQELISYVLHMTASTILFLSEADASLP